MIDDAQSALVRTSFCVAWGFNPTRGCVTTNGLRFEMVSSIRSPFSRRFVQSEPRTGTRERERDRRTRDADHDRNRCRKSEQHDPAADRQKRADRRSENALRQRRSRRDPSRERKRDERCDPQEQDRHRRRALRIFPSHRAEINAHLRSEEHRAHDRRNRDAHHHERSTQDPQQRYRTFRLA